MIFDSSGVRQVSSVNPERIAYQPRLRGCARGETDQFHSQLLL